MDLALLFLLFLLPSTLASTLSTHVPIQPPTFPPWLLLLRG